jgi:hypothetical protein
MVTQLYPHQEEVLPKMHNGCILAGRVGTGKSPVAVAYYIRNEAPRDVYVITTAKKRDNLDWVQEFLGFGVVREGRLPGVGNLTVDSWNNIGKYTDVENAFFIFDEQRLVGSGHWTKSFIKIARANRWILLSATPGDTWLDFIPVFCANGFYKNRTEFKREHVIYSAYSKFPKVERYVGIPRLMRHRNSILVEMPYHPHTKRISTDVLVDYDKDLFERVVKDRWHVYENRPLRDVSELFSVMRKVVNSDTTRLRAVSTLLLKHPKLIVFYNFDYELKLLRSMGDPRPHSTGTKSSDSWLMESSSEPKMSRSFSDQERLTQQASKDTMKKLSSERSMVDGTIPTPAQSQTVMDSSETAGFAVAEWNGHKHEPIPTTDSWLYLVQYTAGSEGWNCIETDAMVFYSLTYSYKAFHQAHGRIDRLNTPFTNLYYYVLKSKSVMDMAVWRSLREKKSFNERKFVDIFT